MPGRIYAIQGDSPSSEKLLELQQQEYEAEELLQRLLAAYPNLLAGDQMDEGAPRRWLLVCREASIPQDDRATGRLALDHLFLDQDAVPTLVEVKRSTDSRIRREVVGQMLDYAANAVRYFPVEMLQSRFEERCRAERLDAENELVRFLGADGDVTTFWQNVKTNLQAGRIRMVFVADEIPHDLRRIVEFLNEQMDPAEVLAVEIRQYVATGLRTLVPRVIGQTAEAQQKKSPVARRQWDEASFFQQMQAHRSELETSGARRILQWARERRLEVPWGTGTRNGSFSPMLLHKGLEHPLLSVYTYGSAEVVFAWMRIPPFSQRAKRLELLRRLNEVPGVSFGENEVDVRPSVPLRELADESRLRPFLAALDWAVEEIRAS